jgi:hypothetical protein
MKGCAGKRVRSESTREGEGLGTEREDMVPLPLPASCLLHCTFFLKSNSELEVVWVESGDRSPFSFTLLLYRGMLGMKEMLEDR